MSLQNRVESPFIIVKIGDYTFGDFTSYKNGHIKEVTYPNYMESLNIVKVNGTVNTYTINMVYAITAESDPNLLDRVFSTASTTRQITVSYGDWEAPSFIYREEKAIITKVATNIDFNNSRIKYVITCTSEAMALKAGVHNFPAKTAKPSTVLLEMLDDEDLKMSDIFTGMTSSDIASMFSLIATDDKEVELGRKDSTNVIDYISYLVSCMVHKDDPGGDIKTSMYYWAIYDDINNEVGGTYFKVLRVDVNTPHNISYNTYEVDVGYPSGNYVTSFSLTNDESWAILYQHAANVELPTHSYTIDDNGNTVESYSPSITTSLRSQKMTETSRTWWTQMTQFPVVARLTVKGLMRPALLMAYVKVNVYFYGHKHISSGLYIITRQEDTIDSNGYKTTLSLMRVSGDELHD